MRCLHQKDSLVLVDAHTSAEASKVLEDDVVLTSFASGDSWRRMHQLEGQISHQLAANSAAVQGDADAVGDDDTEGIVGVLALGDEGGRGQVGVGVLHFAIKSDATDVLVGPG